MTRDALADRIITYCDALAGFSLVNALAFVVTLSDPDIRCSIARIAGFVIGANLSIPVGVTAALVALRRFERRLRPTDGQDAVVERFWLFAQRVRLTLVWLVGLFVAIGAWAATRDPACAVAGG